MRPLLLTTLLICAALTACRKHSVVRTPPPPPPATTNTLVEGAVFKTTGSWFHSERGNSRTFTATSGGTGINWKYRYSGPRGSGSTSSGFVLPSPSAPWLIYVETPDHLWFYDGVGRLSYRRWNPDDTGEAIIDGTLKVNVSDIPVGLVPHLTPELQKLFPAVDTKPRPSI